MMLTNGGSLYEEIKDSSKASAAEDDSKVASAGVVSDLAASYDACLEDDDGLHQMSSLSSPAATSANRWDPTCCREHSQWASCVCVTLAVFLLCSFVVERLYYYHGRPQLLNEKFRRLKRQRWGIERSLGTQDALAAYTDDCSVVFVREGVLVIQPRPMSADAWFELTDLDGAAESGLMKPGDALALRSEMERPGAIQAALETGKLDVARCTKDAHARRRDPRVCAMQATPHSPLPPIVSARLSTEGRFEFVYGTVELRLRLPLGEGIETKIRLLPRSHAASMRREPQLDLLVAKNGEEFMQSAVHCPGPRGEDVFEAVNTTVSSVERNDRGFLGVGVSRRPGYLRIYQIHKDGSTHGLFEWPKMGPKCKHRHSVAHRLPFDVPLHLDIDVSVVNARPYNESEICHDFKPPACNAQRAAFVAHADDTYRSWTRPLEIESVKAYGLRGPPYHK